MILLVNLLGVALIAVIVWWFWIAKPKPTAVAEDAVIEVLVEGGVYTPAHIEARAGRPLRLRFVRKDASPCAEKVVFNELPLSADLPLGQAKELTLPALKPGVYPFTCQMGMYRGRLVVKG